MKHELDKHFRDWEASALGFGYDTGDLPVLRVLKGFFEELENQRSYDYEKLQERFGEETTWFLINLLCREALIEYGTSSRYGWLTAAGDTMRLYFAAKTVEELVELTTSSDEDSGFDLCYRNGCNCGPDGWSAKKLCHNPFWSHR